MKIDMMTMVLLPLLGGALIGLAATLLMLFLGKIAGISGILGLSYRLDELNLWRLFFIVGLLLGGVVIVLMAPDFASYSYDISWWRVVAGGLIVGVGTSMGSGCTSGHGICGISRMSPRSIVATCLFMGTAMITLFIVEAL